jgi:hypothetical protein
VNVIHAAMLIVKTVIRILFASTVVNYLTTRSGKMTTKTISLRTSGRFTGDQGYSRCVE